MSADEVTALLAQAGLFELAIDISKRFSLSMVPVFEALTARSVNIRDVRERGEGGRKRKREREGERERERDSVITAFILIYRCVHLSTALR